MGKGQAFLSDFSISMAVFGIILIAFFIPWNSVVQADTRFSQAEEMKTEARRTASFLVSTEGYPNNWEKNNVDVVIPGFANEDNVISMQKVREFASLEFEEQRSLLKSQGFSMEYYNTQTQDIVEYDSTKYDEDGGLGTEPVAYFVPDTSLSNLDMLGDLNSSTREWYFYYPSSSNQDQLDSLTAEKVYTNSGNVKQMYERMITDATDKGWSNFRENGVVQSNYISFTGDLDGNGDKEIFFQGPNDRLNLLNISENVSTETLSIGNSFQRLGAVADLTSTEGLELAYVDQNDQVAFYNYETKSVESTSEGAKDVGGTAVIGGQRTLFYVTSNNKLGYYSSGSWQMTQHNAGRIGGTGDIDNDGNIEVAFQDGNDNLAFYEKATDNVEATGFQVSDVGGIYGDVVVVKSGNNGILGLWNYSSSNFDSTSISAGSVSALTQLHEDSGFDAIAVDGNSGLGYYDYSLELDRRTVISEKVAKKPDNSQILRQGVEEGITFMQSGPSDGTILTNTFNMNYQDPGSLTVEVQKVHPLLNSSFGQGDQFTFSSDGGFTDVDTVFANSTGSPSSCMACMQKFGDGKVYYIADMKDSSSYQVAFTKPDNVINNGLVYENPFDVGRNIPETAETVIVVDRQVIINKSGEFEKAELRFKSWR